MSHTSDCAVHNAPAFAPGPCDCGARIVELEAMATEMICAIPGGSICDPQQISDALREIAAKHGVTVKDK